MEHDHLMFKAWRESQGQPEDSEPRKGKWNERSKDSTSSQATDRKAEADATAESIHEEVT